jgi:serine/threonine protein kinase
MVVGGEYELLRLIGGGGMGVVWAARHVRSGTSYALKFLRRAPDGTRDPAAIQRFLREARAAAMVRHPHVVFTADVLEMENDWPVIVMELLVGESLRARLARSGPLSLEETARIVLPVISAVGIAHQHGIVHRDLKPDNIFLSRDPGGAAVVKVLDFGIAKMTRNDEQVTLLLGHSGTSILGTPHYMSPEQVFGEHDIDHRADIWALGVILYECLAGQVPTKAANFGQVFKLIVGGGIKPLAAAVPGLPSDATALVDRMLARTRNDRPSDLKEVARLLRRYTTLEVPAFGPSHFERQSAAAPSGESPPVVVSGAPAPAPARPPSRVPKDPRRLTTVRLAMLALALLVGQSLLLWRRRPGQTARESAPAAATLAPMPAPPRDAGPGRH